jgi:hypothetical protein
MTLVADEVIKLDDSLVWLTLREQATTARVCLEALRQRETLINETLVRVAHDVARAARLEMVGVDGREAAACREVFAVIESALRRTP